MMHDAIQVPQHCLSEIDLLYQSGNVSYPGYVADTVLVLHQYKNTGDKVSYQVLCTEANGDTRHTEACQDGTYSNIHLRQQHEYYQQNYDNPADAEEDTLEGFSPSPESLPTLTFLRPGHNAAYQRRNDFFKDNPEHNPDDQDDNDSQAVVEEPCLDHLRHGEDALAFLRQGKSQKSHNHNHDGDSFNCPEDSGDIAPEFVLPFIRFYFSKPITNPVIEKEQQDDYHAGENENPDTIINEPSPHG